MSTQTETIHGNRSFSDRRMSTADQIKYYETQAKLARAGFDSRRTPEFYERQISYLRSER